MLNKLKLTEDIAQFVFSQYTTQSHVDVRPELSFLFGVKNKRFSRICTKDIWSQIVTAH